jgi:hypothetical protein
MDTLICRACQGLSGVNKCIKCGGTGVVYSGPAMSEDQLANLSQVPPNESRDSVGNFAQELKKNVDLFIDQLQEAGLGRKRSTDILTDNDKWIFLQYLKNK